LIRVDDIDIKTAADELENSEDEDLEDVKGYHKKKGKNKFQILAENQSNEEPEEEKPAEKPAEKETKESSDSDEGEKSASSEKEGSAENATESDGNSTSTNGTSKGYKNRDWRAPGREDGDFGFDEPEHIEKNPKYRKEMQRILGKTKEMKKNYGYYGPGGYRNADRYGEASDIFEDNESEKEKEGYYPSDDEEENEMFIRDLHRHGYDGYRGKTYEGYSNAYGRRYKGSKGKQGQGYRPPKDEDAEAVEEKKEERAGAE